MKAQGEMQMETGEKCYCLFAVLAAIIVIVLIASLHGYSIIDWTVSSWIGGVFIVLAVYVCVRCRLSKGEDN